MLQLNSAGSNFPTHDAIVRYMNVETGPPYTMVTASTVTATFAGLGLPPSVGSPTPFIFFIDPVD